jgi:hypothetical protein
MFSIKALPMWSNTESNDAHFRWDLEKLQRGLLSNGTVKQYKPLSNLELYAYIRIPDD